MGSAAGWEARGGETACWEMGQEETVREVTGSEEIGAEAGSEAGSEGQRRTR